MRTIFRKQLILYLGTFAISLALLGAALSQVIRTYFIEQRVATLYDSSARVSAVFEGLFQFGVIDVVRLNQEITAMQQFMGARLIVINTEFQIWGASQGLVDEQHITHFHHPNLEPLMAGYVVETYGTLDGLYREPLLTVGHPIRAGDIIVGAVLVSSSMAELEDTISEMYWLTLLFLTATALVAGVLIYMSSRAISRPLRQMNEAARVIAGGDFEKRIPVQSKDEVGQLAESFNNMAESLLEQERIRRAFISNLSHDIRSPLTSMQGFLQAIDDGTVPEEKLHYYLGIVMDESNRLIKLANNILDISLLQETILSPTAFDINDLIRKTVLSFEPQATAKNLQIHCRFAHESDMVRADYEKIQRVVYNLVDNAVKFVPDGGEIIIETNLDDDFIYVSVQDNGRGISLEEQSQIFERFFKGDPSRNEYKKGSGLGLSIVKELIRAHGGQVTMQSAPGEGCLFTFSLPKE
ncbi:MAG: cell wall metabolism sensor histidine kinase WalK [Defluviitaleaceae bacterium]|nr:cell wall metabolism sensor histidine kinase WalK [Defluviitaleaceae bacterium]